MKFTSSAGKDIIGFLVNARLSGGSLQPEFDRSNNRLPSNCAASIDYAAATHTKKEAGPVTLKLTTPSSTSTTANDQLSIQALILVFDSAQCKPAGSCVKKKKKKYYFLTLFFSFVCLAFILM